jgi:branched-chain amino acid transport system substrate-binding protein
MKKRNRYWFLFILSLVLVMSMVGCGNSTEPAQGNESAGEQEAKESDGNETTTTANEKVKIGVILAETGPASALGKPESDAVKLIKKQLEQQGAINGKEIEIVVYDYETDDTKAVVAMKKLISEDKVVAVVGATQASTTMAIRQEAVANNIPLLSLAPIPKHGDYVFQVPQSNATVLTLIVEYLNKNNIKTVAWTNARDAFGQSGFPVFEKLAEHNGINIVAVEEFDAAATDMSVAVTKIKPKNPGAVIVWSRTPGAGIITKNLKQLGYNGPIIQSHAVANKGFLDQVGANGEGVLVLGSKMSVLDQLPDSEQKTFLQSYQDDFSAEFNYSANSFTGYATDGVNMVIKAIEAGNDTPEKIRDYLDNQMGEYLGISGTFKFSKENHDGPAPDGMTVLEIKNQSWSYSE